MKRSLIPYFQFSSLLFLLVGCSVPSGFHLEKRSASTQIQLESVLINDYKTILYKTRIDVYDSFFSGLFLFKRLNGGNYRVVFLSEFGLNLLDLEFKDDNYKVMSQQKFFNNEAMIKTLARDLGLLIKKNKKTDKIKFLKNENTRVNAVRFQNESGQTTYFYNSDNQLIEITHSNGFFNGVRVQMSDYQKGFPKIIRFEHDWTDFKIRLELLKVTS